MVVNKATGEQLVPCYVIMAVKTSSVMVYPVVVLMVVNEDIGVKLATLHVLLGVVTRLAMVPVGFVRLGVKVVLKETLA